MLLIDTHAHLYYDNMYENLSEVLRLAESNHVKKTICIGTDLETSLKSVEIAEQYDNVYATVGILLMIQKMSLKIICLSLKNYLKVIKW